MSDKKVGRLTFVFNEKDNGGEQLVLTTDLYHNGDPGGFYTNQELSLNSYSNSASFNLTGCQLTPEKLRELANQLDKMISTAKDKK
jgi:hypothetical protein